MRVHIWVIQAYARGFFNECLPRNEINVMLIPGRLCGIGIYICKGIGAWSGHTSFHTITGQKRSKEPIWCWYHCFCNILVIDGRNICSKKYKTVCQRIWEFLNCLLWCLSGFSYNRISVTLFNDDKESRHMNCHMNFHPIIFKSAIMFDCLMTIVHLEYQQGRNGPSNITTQHTTQLQTSPHPQRQLHLLDITAGQILSVTLSPHHP